MMVPLELSNLKPPPGARKKRKRIGRGPGSGRGKTATRGHKGQKARSGKKIKAWMEGGSLLVMGEHTTRDNKGSNRFNEVLD